MLASGTTFRDPWTVEQCRALRRDDQVHGTDSGGGLLLLHGLVLSSPDPVHNIATIQWSATFTGSLRHQIIYKLSALKGGGVLETRSKAYKHGRDRMMVHCIDFPH